MLDELEKELNQSAIKKEANIVKFLFVALVFTLTVYPIAELTQFIQANRVFFPEYYNRFNLELILMWIAYVTGMVIVTWRLK